MKKLKVNGETFEAEKVIKTDKDIIGYDINDNEIFSFKGISDFTGFVLKDGNGVVIEFEAPPIMEIELLKEDSEASKETMNFILMNLF